MWKFKPILVLMWRKISMLTLREENQENHNVPCLKKILLPLYRPAHWTYTVYELWGHRRSDHHRQLHCWKFPKVNSHLDKIDTNHPSSIITENNLDSRPINTLCTSLLWLQPTLACTSAEPRTVRAQRTASRRSWWWNVSVSAASFFQPNRSNQNIPLKNLSMEKFLFSCIFLLTITSDSWNDSTWEIDLK